MSTSGHLAFHCSLIGHGLLQFTHHIEPCQHVVSPHISTLIAYAVFSYGLRLLLARRRLEALHESVEYLGALGRVDLGQVLVLE